MTASLAHAQSDVVSSVLNQLRDLTSAEVQSATGLDPAISTNITNTIVAMPELASNSASRGKGVVERVAIGEHTGMECAPSTH